MTGGLSTRRGVFPVTRAALLVGGVLLLSACPPRASSAAQSETAFACDSTVGLLPAGSTLARRDGRYELLLHASSGAKAGRKTRGILQLEQSTRPVAANVSYPLQGTADISLPEVAADAPGNMASRDRARPGVLVMEYPRGAASASQRDITIRLGHEANGATLSGDRFDGAYMALHLRSISGTGFAGRWNSGQDGKAAGGYFCARRVAE